MGKSITTKNGRCLCGILNLFLEALLNTIRNNMIEIIGSNIYCIYDLTICNNISN